MGSSLTLFSAATFPVWRNGACALLLVREGTPQRQRILFSPLLGVGQLIVIPGVPSCRFHSSGTTDSQAETSGFEKILIDGKHRPTQVSVGVDAHG